MHDTSKTLFDPLVNIKWTLVLCRVV